MEIGYFSQSPKNPIFLFFAPIGASLSMEESPLGEYLLKDANLILCGHMGHKPTEKCPEGMIPTDDEIHNLIKVIKNLTPKHYCICKEDPDEYSHIHFYVHLLEKPDEKKFREAIYANIPRFKNTGRGGKTAFTFSLATVINREYKFPILNKQQQMLLKICYQVKHYSDTEHYRDEITENENYLLMEEMYWKLKAIVQKHTMTKVIKEKKTRIIKDRIKIFFDKKNKFKKEFGPQNQSPDLLYVVEIVCQFYQTEGRDLPHTTTCIERYSLMILADWHPLEHRRLLMKYMHNKFQKQLMI